jgi:hypothetical protein
VSTRRAVVAALVLAGAAGLFFLLRTTRQEPADMTSSGTQTALAAPARALAALPPRTTLAAATAPAEADAGPLGEGDAYAEVERAETALHGHGRRCWDRRTPLVTPPGTPDETMQSVRLELRVVVAAGEGHVELVSVIDDKMQDAGLRDCLLEGLDELRWPTSGPAGVARLRELFRMGDYTVPAGPPPAGSEATR